MYINNENINMQIEFAPGLYFNTSVIQQEIYNNKNNLEYIMQKYKNIPVYIPALLTFIYDNEKYYDEIIDNIIIYCKSTITEQVNYNSTDIFEEIPAVKCLIASLLDNNAVNCKFKKQLIHRLFKLFMSLKAGGLLWAALLEIIYRERKTNSIPIQCITILFRQISFIFNHQYSINNFMMIDTFIQYLTEYEINQSMKILLKKPNLQRWLNKVYIPN